MNRVLFNGKFSPLKVEIIDEYKLILLEDFTYTLYYLGKVVYIITVPKGTVTPNRNYYKAAVIHNWLYRTKYFKRNLCDLHLRYGMIDSNYSKWKECCVYYAVRLFGWWQYYRLTEKINSLLSRNL